MFMNFSVPNFHIRQMKFPPKNSIVIIRKIKYKPVERPIMQDL